MLTKISNFIACLFVFSIILNTNTLMAQSYSIKNRWNVKLAYSSYSPLGIYMHNKNEISPSFQSEVNYGIMNFIEVGPYVGLGTLTTIEMKPITEHYAASKKTNALFYGVNTNLHLLPFLVKSEKFRIDLYASGKIGGFYRLSAAGMYPEKGHVWDYGVYLGAAYYIGRHLGIFGEYGTGNYTNSRFGLSLKF